MDGSSQIAEVSSKAQIYALKKAEESKRNEVSTLLQSLPEPQKPSYNNPPNLGQNVDVKA